jgi:BirA family biotin operon repressor/biotin-[acetyl-CoA-carboxylase] ligase
MIKWPNDLLIDGRKCGGILTECEFMHKNTPLVVLGIGLNVFTPVKAFPKELRNKITSLNRHAPDQIRPQHLLRDILTPPGVSAWPGLPPAAGQ